jgi:RimJ/RimL family protein N-acetyltransferase
MELVLRPATADDVEHVKWALFEAVSWNPERVLPPYEVTIEHPELARYHRGWGRRGDLGVIAADGDEVVGAAICRLFSDDDHGHGYVDDSTPEVTVAVAESHRRSGLGLQLVAELEGAAHAAGFERLSVSIDPGNPSQRIAERLGYHELSRDEGGIRMVRDLERSSGAST